jgi:hypothetical protein
MLMTKMPGYAYPTLAIYPFAWYENGGMWIMWAFKVKPDGTLKWMRHYIDGGDGHARSQGYKEFKEASAVAAEFNKLIRERVNALDLSDEVKLSITLKAEKNVTAEERLAQEEQLMLAEANRRGLSIPKPNIQDLILPAKDGEKYRDDLYAALLVSPKIQLVQLSNHRVSLRRKGEFDWSTIINTNVKTATYCFREKIASAFDMSGVDHWGETKAKIRDLLLPRANKLLKIASVQKMLDEASAKGQHVLVVGSFVFWYEQGKEVGWTVKSLGGDGVAKDSETLWKEGKIVSKNHGRIVVLPYIKENGELVQGHTKNSSMDGKALPRHPDYFLELPFEVLDGDLMIGLFGELPCE